MYKKYYLLFLPLLIAYFLSPSPILSYLAAWLGSFYLLFISISGFVYRLPGDNSLSAGLMRPIILTQIIFCGFNFCTSIFYFLDNLGLYEFVWRETFLVDPDKISSIAAAQRYYLLGHVFLLFGMLFKVQKVEPRFVLAKMSIDQLALRLTILGFAISVAARFVPGLSQLVQQFGNLSFIASTFALSFAIINKNSRLLIVAGLFYLYNFSQSLVSGFKEPIIISLLLLGVFLYPFYKRLILLLALPFFYLAFFIVPVYVGSLRQGSSSGDNVSITQLRNDAIETALEGQESNWDFLTKRLSEMDMFLKYMTSTPNDVPFYGFSTFFQSVEVLIPRILWPGKPITETIVMERVYKAGVADRRSLVSAKPMYIVDGYLAGGAIGIMIALFIYGYVVQAIAQIAEQWFGGYTLGIAIIFNGLFSSLWRGNSFEFILNIVVYSLLTMYVIRRIMERQNILVEVS